LFEKLWTLIKSFHDSYHLRAKRVSTTNPLVSIVTPSYNQGRYLEATIHSVLDQDYPHVEYIIIDGGSTDGSLEIIDRYANQLAYWVSEPDDGQTDAINKGFNYAHGDILAWLNSDDLYRPGAVTDVVEYFHDNPEVGMVYGDADYIDDTGKVIGQFPAAQTDYKRLRRGYVHIPQQATFFRARLWQMVGPLDPSFYFALDYDLWVRIATLAPIRYYPRTWAAFRLHRDAKSLAEADRCWPEMIRVHERLGGGRLSVIYAKYLLRRLLEPVMPLRLHTRLWLQQWAMGRRVRGEINAE
jgi:glycosyltransferase involved in cell wall biosynthesis